MSSWFPMEFTQTFLSVNKMMTSVRRFMHRLSFFWYGRVICDLNNHVQCEIISLTLLCYTKQNKLEVINNLEITIQIKNHIYTWVIFNVKKFSFSWITKKYTYTYLDFQQTCSQKKRWRHCIFRNWRVCCCWSRPWRA